MPHFDLDNATRRTPYRVPEGFFTSLEERIISATVEAPAATAPVRTTKAPRLWRSITSAAAAIIAATAIGFGVYTSTHQSETLNVDQAFANLSTADQQFLLDTYDNERMLEAYMY